MTLLEQANDWLRDNCSMRLIKPYDASRLADFAESVTPKWTYCVDAMPPYDGWYLCTVRLPQECGNIWIQQEILMCSMNTFPERVIAWMPLPDPAK